MDKKEQSSFDMNWYEWWVKQSKTFFESAEKNLQQMFNQAKPFNPEEHLKQIHAWLNSMKDQWQFTPLNEQQKTYEKYTKLMAKIYSDACDLMLEKWINRSHENNPIKDVRELYELWLNCCHEVYQKSMHAKKVQEAYADFMNAAIQFWKSAVSSK